MIQVAPGTKVGEVLRPLRMRYGFDGLSAKVVEVLRGSLQLTPAQLALLIEAIDWRRTVAPALPAVPTAV